MASQGRLQGGGQPISGATIQLYAVGTTGLQSAAMPLLATPAVTDSRGAFNITGQYSCPSFSSLVYLVATGGNPGLTVPTNNTTLALMTALGACGDLKPTTFIFTNEMTTVAAVWALAPYMSSYSSIGSTATDPGLTNAFALATQFVNTATGAAPGVNVPAGATVPAAEINTIADILTVCVNSAGGTAGDGSPCGTLLSAATPAGRTPPTNVIAAALNIANNPDANVDSLFSLVGAAAPFQPTLTVAPPNFVVSMTLASTLTVSPSSLSFPSTIPFIHSVPQSVTLTNTGATAIPIYALVIGGANSSDFGQVNDCAESLGPGASCSVQVTYTPTANGARHGYLRIENGSPNPMLYIDLAGTTTTNAGGQSGPVTVSPASLSFTQVGTPQQVTLSNLGPTALTIQSVNLSGGYSQTNNCGSVLGGQSTCTFSVTLNDASQGATGALVLFDDATTGSQTVQLSFPVTNSTSPAFYFGASDIGVSTGSQGYYGYSGSKGGTTMTGSISGTNASDFYFVGPDICSSTSNGCTLYVAFNPTAPGYRTATLSTTYGSVTLNGVGNPGGPAAFSLSPPLVKFVGAAAGIQAINLGGTVLNLSPSIGGLNPGSFSYESNVIGTGYCGATLAVGKACVLPLDASSKVVGTRTAILTMTDTSSGLARSVYLTNTADYDSPQLLPYNLQWYHDTQVGAVSAPQTATATVPPEHALTVSISQGADQFQITSPGYCPAGVSCQISVVFAPKSTICANGTLLVTDTTTGKTATTSLLGCGGLPAISLSSSTLAFVARNVGSTSTSQTVTVSNPVSAELYISGISVMGTNAGDFQQTNTCPISNGSDLLTYQTCTISVSFTPSASGSRTAYVQILSNAPTSPDVIQLTGTGN